MEKFIHKKKSFQYLFPGVLKKSIENLDADKNPVN